MYQLKCDSCEETAPIPAATNQDRYGPAPIPLPPGWTRLAFIHRSSKAVQVQGISTDGGTSYSTDHPITHESQDYCGSCTKGIMAALAGALKSDSRVASPDAC